jgi:hypothetical protein
VLLLPTFVPTNKPTPLPSTAIPTTALPARTTPKRVELEASQTLKGIDMDAYSENPEANNLAIKSAILKCMPNTGATLDSFVSFTVTAATDEKSMKSMRSSIGTPASSNSSFEVPTSGSSNGIKVSYVLAIYSASHNYEAVSAMLTDSIESNSFNEYLHEEAELAGAGDLVSVVSDALTTTNLITTPDDDDTTAPPSEPVDEIETST